MKIFLLASVLATASMATGQCGALDITGSGAAGTDLTISVTGSTPDSYAALFIAENTGTTTIGAGPLFSLELGLAGPVIPFPLGGTDSNGDVSVTITVPPGLTTPWMLNAQAGVFTVSVPPLMVSACATNVAPVTVGG